MRSSVPRPASSYAIRHCPSMPTACPTARRLPDGLGTVRTNETGEIVFRNYVWQEKDDYLAKLSFQFEVDRAGWKQAPGARLRMSARMVNVACTTH